MRYDKTSLFRKSLNEVMIEGFESGGHFPDKDSVFENSFYKFFTEDYFKSTEEGEPALRVTKLLT